jgi:hypothetical protein
MRVKAFQMSEYEILKIEEPFAQYLVFGYSSDSPLFALNEIDESLNLFDGEQVLFDQLLQTGDSKNRFLLLTIRNGKFDLNSAENIDKCNVSNGTKSLIASCLLNKPNILRYCILTSKQKEHIIHGGII